MKTKLIILMLLATVVYGQSNIIKYYNAGEDTIKSSGTGLKNYGNIVYPIHNPIALEVIPSWLYMDISIGEIKVKGWMAKEYFKNLTANPDTIWETIWDSQWSKEDGRRYKEYDKQNILAHRLEKWDGAYIRAMGWIIPRKPTEQDFIKWYLKQKECQ